MRNRLVDCASSRAARFAPGDLVQMIFYRRFSKRVSGLIPPLWVGVLEWDIVLSDLVRGFARLGAAFSFGATGEEAHNVSPYFV